MYSLRAINNLGRLYRNTLNKMNELLKKYSLNVTSDEVLFLFEIFDYTKNVQVYDESNEKGDLYIKDIGKKGNYLNSYLMFNMNLLQRRSFIKISGDLSSPIVELTQTGIDVIKNIQKKIESQTIICESINKILLNNEKINCNTSL
jgi:hypothetical protein